ncbi:hypothetical protein D9758_009252 [Tetrapyrgos nigripes]|uniref:Nuclear receptor 2C2-associated protein n=1 Tax=Tetrapyrgos nigripes TaxID=182062 RepID=A0A8H5D333_9AGAR|nr:hypothetical protein D9758_009252 [Tetrapyrgos nigripes]
MGRHFANRVSSTLDKSVGKKYLVDGSPETCWTSQQGLPQWISLTFTSTTPITPTRISFTFQGGFVGKKCAVHYKPYRDLSQAQDNTSLNEKDKDPWTLLTYIYPEDVNRRQTFDLKPSLEASASALASVKTNQMKLTFEESTDFFGRITVYDLGVEGFVG